MRIRVPSGRTVRPTTDRVRESLFSILAPRLPGCRFLDLYAGSGAVGLEALSRGAGHAVFVEKDRRATAVLRDNLHLAGMSRASEVRTGAAETVVAALGREDRRFDIGYVDPPYEAGLVEKTLAFLARAAVVDPEGWVVVETSFRQPPPEEVSGFVLQRRERYGEALLSFYRPEAE